MRSGRSNKHETTQEGSVEGRGTRVARGRTRDRESVAKVMLEERKINRIRGGDPGERLETHRQVRARKTANKRREAKRRERD